MPILAPTSDKNPHEEDKDASKVFESCQLSPVKHRQEFSRGSLEFNLDEDDDDHYVEEMAGLNRTFTEPERSPTSQGLPMNSTYVVTAPSANGMYLPDESETINPLSHTINDKTYVVANSDEQMKEDETNNTSRTSSTNSFHAPQHSEITKQKFRRLSDIINRERRRSSILTAAASSAANSPAIEEEKPQQEQQPSMVTVVNTTINVSTVLRTTVETSAAANCSVDLFDEKMDTTESESPKENVDASYGGHDYVFENNFEKMPKYQHDASVANNGTILLEDVRTPTKYLEDSNFTMSLPPTAEEENSFSTVHKPSDSDEAMITLQQSDSDKSIISQKSVFNQTFDIQQPSEVSTVMPNGLPAIDKKLIRK
uniref:Uncharacterized protein n=1 Tax=Panagrolaimus sp. ES5 TaxID=591445 RepID=A0AC34GC81_9BILA